MGEIFAALKAVLEIINTAKSIVKFVEDNKREQWFQDAAKAFGDFKQKTPEERKKLAKDVSDLLRGV